MSGNEMKLAISGCLLGENVRFDGGHSHYGFITEQLSEYAEFLPFCPEHLAFGTPRESMRLIKNDAGMTLLTNQTHSDTTERLQTASRQEIQRLPLDKLSGIIFKSRSPSCGVQSAKFYYENGFAGGKDDGIMVKAVKSVSPYLPIIDEGRLEDAWLRENFVMQLFAYSAMQQLNSSATKVNELVIFHTSYKFLLSAKDEKSYRELGNIVANHNKLPFSKQLEAYRLLFNQTIARKSSIKKNRNALEHMAGFFKTKLTSHEKHMLHVLIEDYTNRLVPLITPLALLEMFANKYDVVYIKAQRFLNPYPKELALRSEIGSGR